MLRRLTVLWPVAPFKIRDPHGVVEVHIVAINSTTILIGISIITKVMWDLGLHDGHPSQSVALGRPSELLVGEGDLM